MSTTREKIIQKLNPKLLKMTPKLSAENGLFVNLEPNDSLEEGAKELLKRFWRNQDLCEKNKRNASQNEVEVTVTSTKLNEENEICDILSERLKLPRLNEESVSDRPGKNLQKLKMQLQEKMSAKWEEEYRKRVNENKPNKGQKKLKHKEKKDDSFDEDNDSKDSCEDDDEDKQGVSEDDGCEGDVEEEEEVEDSVNNDAISAIGADEKVRLEGTPVENPSKGMEFEDMESCSLPPAYQPGGGLLYGGSELTQCDDDLPENLLPPSLNFGAPESPQCQGLNDSTPNGKESVEAEEFINSFLVRNKLFSQNPNDSFDLNDAYELCSGKFPDESSNLQLETEVSTTQPSKFTNEDVEAINQDEEEGVESENEEEDDDSEDNISEACDKSEGESDDEPDTGPKIRKSIITFEDSEDEEKEEEEEESRQPEVEEHHEAAKILSDDEEDRFNKTKKKRRNLRFSDDECENDEGEKEETDSEKEEEEEEEVDDRDEVRSIQYDSEENEINPREFFEKEAELSGSEWSVDEDERGLDDFDVEEGDADNLDNDEVRSQLEKIHLRQMLNEDARNVRLIQEILFEDGDLYSDGKGRNRKFRWKNLGKTFEEDGETGTKDGGGDSSEDERVEEEHHRKLRLEKELFLMEKKQNGEENLDEEIIQDFQSVKVTSVKSLVKVSSAGTAGNTKTVLNHTEIGRHVTLSKARGSFLTRNEEFLTRLAKVSSSISENIMGPKHSKNFVFATKSPEKMEPNKSTACKRQVDDAEIRDGRRDKKFKILPSDVDTGPSILDLLV